MPDSPVGTDLEAAVSLYDNRWTQIRHLDELDSRYLVLAVTALAGAAASANNVVFSRPVQALIAALAAVVCLGASYSVTRNRLSFILTMHSIEVIELRLHEWRHDLYPWVRPPQAPKTFRQFADGILWSIRGALLAFFGLALAGIVTIVGRRIYPGVVGGWFTAAAFGVTLAGLAICFCLWHNWSRGRQRFVSINSPGPAVDHE